MEKKKKKETWGHCSESLGGNIASKTTSTNKQKW